MNNNQIISLFIQTQKAIGRSIQNNLGYAALIIPGEGQKFLTTEELKLLSKNLRSQF